MHNSANTSLTLSGESSFVATAESMGLITMETRHVFGYLAFILGSVLGVFGIGSNIVNIIIFYRQGLDNTVNISFFTLAISDIGSLINMVLCATYVSPPLVTSGLPVDFPRFLYLTNGWPHFCFSNITSWITVYITAERCLCIALPLKVKKIITPRVTASIISVIYVLNIMIMIPDYIYYYVGWTFSIERNRTILGLAVRENFQFLDGVSLVSVGTLGTVPFPTVIVLTVILVVKLRQQAAWRQKSTQDSQKAQLTSQREIRTMKMVVFIAVVLIICYIPGIVTSTTTVFFPSFDLNGRYVNIWFVSWSIAYVMHEVNSSVNIFLYYRMSSKFKRSLHQLFDYCVCVPRDDDAD